MLLSFAAVGAWICSSLLGIVLCERVAERPGRRPLVCFLIKCIAARRHRWTGSDHVALIQQMAYVVGTDGGVIRDAGAREAFRNACFTVRAILIFLKLRSFTKNHVPGLRKHCRHVGPFFQQLADTLPAEFVRANLDIPKVHACLHFLLFILLYGSALNFDTSTHERLHKEVVGYVLDMDCRREKDRLKRMLAIVNERSSLAIVETLLSAEAPAGKAAEAVADARRMNAGLHFVGSKDTGVVSVAGFLNESTPSVKISIRRALRLYTVGDTNLLTRLATYTSFPCLKHDFGSDVLTYVAAHNYLKRGPRFDNVVVRTGAGSTKGTRRRAPVPAAAPVAAAGPLPAAKVGAHGMWPAELKMLFCASDGTGVKYAVVQYYEFLVLAADSPMKAALCKKLKPSDANFFSVIEADEIAGHAHMVPAFGDYGRGDDKLYYFDVVDAV